MGAERQVAREPAPARTPEPAAAPTPSQPGLLDLQRKVGNRATVALIRREVPRPVAPAEVIRRKVTAVSQLRPATREELGAEPAVETPVTADRLRIDEVHIPGGIRPPTRVANSQGRHTVAWAARVREWSAAFRGPLQAVLGELTRRTLDDTQLADTPEYQAVTRRLRILESPTARPESDWVRSVSELITAYIVAYQRSEFAVFPSTNPKGRGEADRIKKLNYWSELPTGVEPDEVVEAARFLLDTHGSMANDVRHKVVSDWLRMLQTVWPALFGHLLRPPSTDVVDSIKTLGVQGQRLVEEALSGKDVKAKLVEALSEADQMVDEDSPTPTTEEPTAPSDSGEDLEQSRSEAEEQDRAVEEGRNVDARFGTRSYVVGVELGANGATPAVTARVLRVDRLDIANERADTQFGKKQQNHVTPWSVERVYWSKRFVGKSLEVALDLLGAKASSLGLRLEELPPTATVGQWSAILDRRVEAVIAAEQASKSATFIAEPDQHGKSTATGHGESPALLGLTDMESSCSGRIESADVCSQVRARFRALIDLPQLDSTRTSMGWDESRTVQELRREWETKMKLLFPKVCAAYAKELAEAFDRAEEPTDYFLVMNESCRLETRIGELDTSSGPRSGRRRSSRLSLAQPDGPSADLNQARSDLKVLKKWGSPLVGERDAAVVRAKELRDSRRPATDRTRKVDDSASDGDTPSGSPKRQKETG